jgi:dolichol kinase
VLRDRLDELVQRTWSDAASLLAKLDALLALLNEAPSAEDARAAWMEFRSSVQPAYEELVAAMAAYDVHLPSLRPTNYVRNVFHVANAVWVLCLVEYVLTTQARLLGVALAGAVWAWSMEIGRRWVPAVNTLLMKVFGPVAHPHEAHRVNSATWYATALVALALCFDVHLGVAGLAVLGLGDPMAALIGRRFGRTELVNGRSLEGSVAFVLFGSVAAFAALALWHPELGLRAHLVLAGVTAVFGAVAELLTRRIDDNLAIPVVGAFGGQLATWALL